MGSTFDCPCENYRPKYSTSKAPFTSTFHDNKMSRFSVFPSLGHTPHSLMSSLLHAHAPTVHALDHTTPHLCTNMCVREVSTAYM